MAVAALVLGALALLFGVIPVTFFMAWLLGTAALIFGLVARRRPVRTAMATWGALLGLAAIAMGVVGLVILWDAFDDLEELSYPSCTELVDGQQVPPTFIDEFGDINLSCQLDDNVIISIQFPCFDSDRHIAWSEYGYAFRDDQIFRLGDRPAC